MISMDFIFIACRAVNSIAVVHHFSLPGPQRPLLLDRRQNLRMDK